MTLLYVHELSVAADAGHILLDQISFDVEPGKALGLAGGPDAGKSLLCEILAGRVPEGVRISGGRILFGNRDFTAELRRAGARGVTAPTVNVYDNSGPTVPSDRPRNVGRIITGRDPAELADRCDEIAVLCAGRLVERGPARDLVRAPQHPYTQALVDARGSTDSMAPTSDGCPFSEGCSFAEAACDGARLALQSVSTHHATACVRWRSLRPLAA